MRGSADEPVRVLPELRALVIGELGNRESKPMSPALQRRREIAARPLRGRRDAGPAQERGRKIEARSGRVSPATQPGEPRRADDQRHAH